MQEDQTSRTEMFNEASQKQKIWLRKIGTVMTMKEGLGRQTFFVKWLFNILEYTLLLIHWLHFEMVQDHSTLFSGSWICLHGTLTSEVSLFLFFSDPLPSNVVVQFIIAIKNYDSCTNNIINRKTAGIAHRINKKNQSFFYLTRCRKSAPALLQKMKYFGEY